MSNTYEDQVLDLVQKANNLIVNLGSRKNNEQIRDLILHLISLLKAERKEELAIFTEYIKNIIETVIAGRLLPNSEVKELVSSAINEIKDNLHQSGEIVVSDTAKRMKLLLENAKRSEERDFFYTKKIRVLYATKSTSSQLSGKFSGIDKSLQIESCFSGAEALERLRDEQFDAIMCELKLSDPDVIEMIKLYADRIPIVAISGSGDLKLNDQLQANKTQQPINYLQRKDDIPRSLHSILTNEWLKQVNLTNKRSILEDPKTKTILEYMIGTRQPVKQKICPKITYDWKIDGGMKADFARILEDLIEIFFVTKQESRLTLSCPKCYSVNIVTNYLCPNCKASDFTRGNVLEHNKCGHSALETNFHEDDKLVCPKCRKELKLIGVDYFRITSATKCKQCHNTFAVPEITYDCDECGNTGFRLSDASWKQIYNYEINPEKLEEIKQSITSLAPIERFLEMKGFHIRLDRTIILESQSYGPFDLVADRDSELILISVIGSEIENTIAKIIDLDNISKFTQLKVSKYAILFGKPTEIARNLIDKFDILPILVENENDILSRFKENFRG